jgi:hypothetical protein
MTKSICQSRDLSLRRRHPLLQRHEPLVRQSYLLYRHHGTGSGVPDGQLEDQVLILLRIQTGLEATVQELLLPVGNVHILNKVAGNPTVGPDEILEVQVLKGILLDGDSTTTRRPRRDIVGRGIRLIGTSPSCLCKEVSAI